MVAPMMMRIPSPLRNVVNTAIGCCWLLRAAGRSPTGGGTFGPQRKVVITKPFSASCFDLDPLTFLGTLENDNRDCLFSLRIP